MSDVTTTLVAAAGPIEATSGADQRITDSDMGETTEQVAAVDVAPKSEEKAPDAEAQKVASKFAALSRQEKALKVQQRELAARIKEFEAKSADAGKVDTTKYIDAEDFKKNPYKYMQAHNLTLEQVAEIVMNDGKQTPEKLVSQTESKLEAKIKELEERYQKDQEAVQAEKIAQAEKSFKTALTTFVNETEDYEMIRAEDAVGLVYDVINQNFESKVAEFIEENGEEPSYEERQAFILSNKEASDMVEKYLLDQEVARNTKLRALKKTKGLFEPAAKPVEQKVKSPGSPTLTNNLAAQVPGRDSKTLTDEESKREAAKLIRFTE